VALAIVAGLSAYGQLFTTWRYWDDEGYMLVSLRNFAAGGKLYSEVFSQYGPAYSLFFAGLHRYLGLALDSGGARWVALLSWTAATLLSAMLVHRVTRSWWWGLAGGAVVFFQLHLLVNEPLHPVDLIAVLLAASFVAASLLLAANRRSAAGSIAATAGVILAFIKINVGLFYLAGLAVFLLWSTSGIPSRRWAKFALGMAALVAGVALMRALLAEAWVKSFLAVYVVASATTLGVLALEVTTAGNPRETLRAPLLTAIAAVAAVFIVSLIAHISPAELWEGVIRGPLLQPVFFYFPFRWSGLTLPVLVLNAGGFLAWLYLRHCAPLWSARLIAAGRLAVGTGFLFSYFHGFAVSVEAYLLSFGVGFIWVLAAPLLAPSPKRDQARQLLAAIALFQVLHAFPVAGTQISLGTLPLALLLVLALHEVAIWIGGLTFPSFALALTVATVAFPVWGCARLTQEATQNFLRHPAESFTGSNLHLSRWQSSTLATLVANARRHGDLLFSLPGQFSFNEWTGLPTPNQFNCTHWWSFISDERQASIARQLSVAVHPVIIVQRNLIESGLIKATFRPSRLTKYIDENFERIFSIDSYEFWVRRGRAVSPIGIARWAPGGTAARELSFSFAGAATSGPVPARVEFIDLQTASILPAPAHFNLTTENLAAEQLVRWTCTFSPAPGFSTEPCDSARFYSAAGQLIHEIRFERPPPQRNPL
jgi:hypothetical protein